VSLDRPFNVLIAIFFNFAVNVLLNLLVSLNQRDGLALSLSLSVNQLLAAVPVDCFLLLALLLHILLELNRALFNGSSVHLLRVIVFEELFELLLIFIQFQKRIFKNVLSYFNLSIAEFL